jgi:hypothetical protein
MEACPLGIGDAPAFAVQGLRERAGLAKSSAPVVLQAVPLCEKLV